MLISIITATYNSAKTVRDTFESILAQGYQDYECIVVDGASKDGTLDIIREYEPKFGGRMKWTSEPDKGIYDAMNKGIARSRGDVVGLLNSDDFYTSDQVLQEIADTFLSDPSLDAVYADVHYCRWDDISRPVRYYSSKGFRRWKMFFGYMPAHPSFYCKKEIYERFGAFDTSLKVAADFECLLRFCYVQKIKTRYIPRDFVTMREGGASSSGVQSHLAINRDHLTAFRKNGVHSNTFFESFRYVFKTFEVILSRIRYKL